MDTSRGAYNHHQRAELFKSPQKWIRSTSSTWTYHLVALYMFFLISSLFFFTIDQNWLYLYWNLEINGWDSINSFSISDLPKNWFIYSHFVVTAFRINCVQKYWHTLVRPCILFLSTHNVISLIFWYLVKTNALVMLVLKLISIFTGTLTEMREEFKAPRMKSFEHTAAFNWKVLAYSSIPYPICTLSLLNDVQPFLAICIQKTMY